MHQSVEPEKIKHDHQLSFDLIEAQYRLRNSRGSDHSKSVLIIVSGIELAGKGEAVKQLREWVDPRYLYVNAEPPQLLGNQQPFWQPYAQVIPAEGQVVVLFSNWYNDLLNTAMHVSKPLDDTMFDAYIHQMRKFEQDLKNNQVDVIKFWFDLSWKSLQKRLDNMNPSQEKWHKLHGLDWRNKKQYDNLQRLRQRYSNDWIVLDCENKHQRNREFAEHLLLAFKDLPKHTGRVADQWTQAPIPQNLLNISHPEISKKHYKAELKKITRKVTDYLQNNPRKIVIVFEGMDAAGKGGAIRRIVKKLDPREYEINCIAAPERYELRHPYLWRFWTKLGSASQIRIFDRSWYGRVLVERIENLAQDFEWQRAYEEINRFEKDLADTETIVIKFWLAISQDEQAERFKIREQTPHKRFKITSEDWRNREKWDDYLSAASDMFYLTNTAYAPWHIISTDSKRQARLEIMRALLKQLKTG
ncbi:phosphate--AMP phosphotransferase [Acinetobacter sp. ME22]|uniref:polyphosphate:AMP phosphotransferase n=1 Tax=Acinetobacter sp. ME22 TaxID=2904802 RepID=UPI001EDA142F|nr:phosphate--AMP phosphotransferase [Acinetobacter sp. ME22]MCG2573733.1 phosphate--AMP phosphotransferase [Acinetobacter sp. ME22]